jgi:hypothetical protein
MARRLDVVYEEARACVAGLREAGHAEHAESLDAAPCGATSGEVLTTLGTHVTSILGSRPRLPEDLRGRLRALLAGIDGILRNA